MKRVLSLPFLVFWVVLASCMLPLAAAAAAPPVAWAHALGGTAWDDAYALDATTDGGFIVAGETESVDGDASGNHGASDAWIVKVSGTGGVAWQRCIGGMDYDSATDIQRTADGGFIVAGYTHSTDGQMAANHGGSDAWVAKLDAGGAPSWIKCLGGSDNDFATAVLQTSDGGYAVGAFTGSTDGQVSGNHGFYDAWVVRLDSAGNLLWQKALGGSDDELSPDLRQELVQTADGGFLLAGQTRSNDGDVRGNHGEFDLWVAKLTATGTLSWQKALGGSGYDAAGRLQPTPDGGCVVAGETASTNGDVAGNHGGSDVWVVRLGATGTLTWQRCLGGSLDEFGRDIRLTPDGGYVVAGYTYSNDGDVAGNHGDSDAWVAKLDATGIPAWQKPLGGSGEDAGERVVRAADGGYVMAGNTKSNDGDVMDHHGDRDAWIVKLDTAGPAVLPVPPNTLPPTDPDGDGKYDDVNGNGGPDFADIVLYFNAMSWIAANEPLAAFDYNGNGAIDFADLIWLFNSL